MSDFKKFIYALSTITAATIGAGIFSLPFITLKAGFWTMIGYFVVLGGLAILIHLFYGELVLKTPDYKRLPGFAKLYLGKWGEKIASFSIIFGVFGVILVYLIVGGEFLESLFSPIFGGNNLIYTFLYFSVGAILIFFGIKFVPKLEFWGLVLFFIILIAIFIKEINFLKIENLFLTSWNIKYFFLPYGAILFSLWGADLIPEAEEILGEKKKLLRIIIPLAIIIAILIYIFFIYLILSITGSQTTESALTGLKSYVGNGLLVLGLLFGLLTTFTSFIAFGLNLRNTLWYDLKIPRGLAWGITCFLPLILFLAGFKSFIGVISFVGGVMLGIDGILILLMYQKMNHGKKILIISLLTVFLIGIIYEIIYFIK